MYTSGTTGEPKGILATVANLRHYLDFMQARYQIGPVDRLSQLFESSFDASLFDILMTLNHGASFHVVPESQIMAPGKFIQDARLTLFFGVPSTIAFLNRMRMLKPGTFPLLRISIFGGEPLPRTSMLAWLEAAPNTVLDNVYGPTEATVTCFIQRCAATAPVTPERDVLAIGQPYDGMLGGVVDKDSHFIGPGQHGEIVIAGPQVTPGYWRDPQLTAQKFRHLVHPEFGEQIWYFTGDAGYQDNAGVFHHLGRLDHQIKVSGHRVELEEVDTHLRAVCGSDAAAAVAWPVEHGSARGLVAFVSGTSLDSAAIVERLKQRMPGYMVPRRVIQLDALPYTLNGKVDRKALTDRLQQADPGTTASQVSRDKPPSGL
jgi:acyl-coenzyme A synthetase/AMP-(fatty) acid ligase